MLKCTQARLLCAQMYTSTSTVCSNVHKHVYCVLKCTQLRWLCAQMYTSTFNVCSNVHKYVYCVLKCTHVCKKCAIFVFNLLLYFMGGSVLEEYYAFIKCMSNLC